MESEISNFTKVWLAVTVCLCYCYAIGKMISKGLRRLVFVTPVVCLFLYLPLLISSAHLGGITAFFVAWLANFKLLLFAFGLGPLSSDPSISLPLFVIVSCLPIKIQHKNGHNKETPPPKTHQNVHNGEIPPPKSYKNGQNGQRTQINTSPDDKTKEGPVNYAIKVLLLAVLIRVYDYSDHIHPKIILLLYCLHIYFLLELILAVSAALARAMLGLELEPQFNEPYLSTSLQDFWGKRWNLVVSSILRPVAYKPILGICARALGRSWAPIPAIFGTFLVSGLMHELMFFYLGREPPTWEVTWFFVLHGFCLATEVALKKAVAGEFRLPPMISGPLTVGFVIVTGFWLFFPQFTRCRVDVRAFEEYAAVGSFLKNVGQNLLRF